MFIIDTMNGALHLAQNLTGRYGYYRLVLEAKDLGHPESLSSHMNVTIMIDDYNDHPPVITQPKHKSLHTVDEVFDAIPH